MLVEDEPLVRGVAERMLRSRGYCVRKAGNAEEALGILRDPAQAVALLLSDIVLPGPSGADLAEQAVRLRPGLRVMFVSGFAEHAAVERLNRHGCRILRKPFGIDELAREVQNALNSPACLGGGT
ncbi:MAG: response regulator [Elusimicrobia bacterium]|nr:response regulator [Elusimicrobiota bacterium]